MAHNRNGFGNGRRNGNGNGGTTRGNGAGGRGRATQKPYTGHIHIPPAGSPLYNKPHTSDSPPVPQHEHTLYGKESPPHSGNDPHSHQSAEISWTDSTGPSHSHVASTAYPHSGSLYGGAHIHHFAGYSYNDGYRPHKHHSITSSGTGAHRHDPLRLPTSTQRSGGGGRRQRTMGSKTTRRGRERRY